MNIYREDELPGQIHTRGMKRFAVLCLICLAYTDLVDSEKDFGNSAEDDEDLHDNEWNLYEQDEKSSEDDEDLSEYDHDSHDMTDEDRYEGFELNILPMDHKIIVLWHDSRRFRGAIHSLTVNHSTDFKQVTTVKEGLLIDEVNHTNLNEICVEAIDHEDEREIKCLNQSAIDKYLPMHVIPESMDIQAVGNSLLSRWTTGDSWIKNYYGVWMKDREVIHSSVIHHNYSKIELHSFKVCHRYTFSLYGILKYDSWVEIGHQVWNMETDKRGIKNVDAFPLAKSILVIWHYPKKCRPELATITVTHEQEVYKHFVYLSALYFDIHTMGNNGTYRVIITSIGSEGHAILDDFNRSFSFDFDPQLSVPIVESEETRTDVYWLDKPTNATTIVAIWFQDKDMYEVQRLKPRANTLVFHRPDPCNIYHIVLIKIIDSEARVNIGSITVKEDLSADNKADAFRIGEELFLIWEPAYSCKSIDTLVLINTDIANQSFRWPVGHQIVILRNVKVDAFINLTFVSHRFSIQRTFQRDTSLISGKHPEFSQSTMEFTWKLNTSNAYELMVFWDLGNHIKHQFYSPEDWHSVYYPTDPCLEHTVSVIQMFHSGLRIDTGQNTLRAGKPLVTKVAVSGTRALIDWTMNYPCNLVAFNLRWIKVPKVSSVTVDRPSPRQVLISNLEDCHEYEFQLVASYAGQIDLASDPVRLNVSLGSSRAKPNLSISNGILTVRWQTSATCNLVQTIVHIFRDGHKVSEKSYGSNVTESSYDRLISPSIYSVSLTLIYDNNYAVNSAIGAIQYIQKPQFSIQLDSDLVGAELHLTWNVSAVEDIMYYRIDANYNTKKTFTMITTEKTLMMPLVHAGDNLNVVVMAVSGSGIPVLSNLVTMRPENVPPKPTPIVWQKKDSNIFVRWDLEEGHPEYRHRLIVRDLHGTVVRHIDVAPSVREQELIGGLCIDKGCSIALQAVNNYGKSQESVPVRLP